MAESSVEFALTFFEVTEETIWMRGVFYCCYLCRVTCVCLKLKRYVEDLLSFACGRPYILYHQPQDADKV